MRQSYRRGMAEGRTQLDQVVTRDDEATAKLQAECIPIVRVDRHPNGNLVVVWRNAPTPAQCDRADTLLDVRAGHSH